MIYENKFVVYQRIWSTFVEVMSQNSFVVTNEKDMTSLLSLLLFYFLLVF